MKIKLNLVHHRTTELIWHSSWNNITDYTNTYIDLRIADFSWNEKPNEHSQETKNFFSQHPSMFLVKWLNQRLDHFVSFAVLFDSFIKTLGFIMMVTSHVLFCFLITSNRIKLIKTIEQILVFCLLNSVR